MIQINLVRNEFIYGNVLRQKLKTAMTVRKSVLPLAANMNLVEQEIMDVKLKSDHFNLKMITSHIFWRKYEISSLLLRIHRSIMLSYHIRRF